MKRLVVGVDGSTASEMAVRWASAIASETGAGITVAHVFDYRGHDDASRPGASVDNVRAKWVEALNTARIEHDMRFLLGDPPTKILELASEVGADMIVIGRRGHSLLAPRLLGSFTRRLLETNETPIAIVPAPSEQESQVERAATVVVGLDGTQRSQSVLSFAASVGDALDCDIQALTVIDIHGDPVPIEQRSGQVLESAERTLRQLVNAVNPQCRHRITTHVVVGVPADELLRRSSHAELLVVGHRRTTPIGRFLAHAASRYCAAHAACPVVLVPIEPAVDYKRRRLIKHPPHRSLIRPTESSDSQTPTGEVEGASHG